MRPGSSDEVLPPALSGAPCKREGADCPAGGSTLVIASLGPWWDAMRIWSGSGARTSPGTVVKVTAWAESIQIGIPLPAPYPRGSSNPSRNRHPGMERCATTCTVPLGRSLVPRSTNFAEGRQRPGSARCRSQTGGRRTPAGRTRRPAPLVLPFWCCRSGAAVLDPGAQSRSKPRLASSRRIASPVPGPKAG